MQKKLSNRQIAYTYRERGGLLAKLDQNLIEQKKKDPREWQKFLDKGRALNKLLQSLRFKLCV